MPIDHYTRILLVVHCLVVRWWRADAIIHVVHHIQILIHVADIHVAEATHVAIHARWLDNILRWQAELWPAKLLDICVGLLLPVRHLTLRHDHLVANDILEVVLDVAHLEPWLCLQLRELAEPD